MHTFKTLNFLKVIYSQVVWNVKATLSIVPYPGSIPIMNIKDLLNIQCLHGQLSVELYS